jgi:transcriptional regulator with XRE-family HTH domain/KaiC/GvpD/RAD55 family RecA-like ATPase
MVTVISERQRVASGVKQLDFLLGGLFIGDNVLWHDDAGSLAAVFCLNFIQVSQALRKPLIYVSFDRSPKNLLEKLGPLADFPQMVILDCFTHGKGASSPTFLKFYEDLEDDFPCSVSLLEHPRDYSHFTEVLYDLHGTMEGDVRFIFESITGMQELWGSEDRLLNFYSHSCPRLYELNTIAYWILEKNAHSQRFRAQINQIAQVAIELSIKRGTTSLTILKAENRQADAHYKPHKFWTKDLTITFDTQKRISGEVDLGLRLKYFRTKRGLSQTELAKLVGVTPSTISQVESNLIYPALPALMKMAEVLSVDVTSFFQDQEEGQKRLIFPSVEATDLNIPELPQDSISAKMLSPVDAELKAEPYIIEIPPRGSLPSHFFVHKGEEFGYLLSGRLQVRVGKAVYSLRIGDVIYLTSEMPAEWKNPSPMPARLLWVKVK